jgi:ABC-type uncharacterized transport system involved in gliding motility auxiliary subunit
MAAMDIERSSNLEALVEAWGLNFDTSRFVADAGLALQVNLRQNPRPVRHPALLGIPADLMNSDDVVTSELSAVNVASIGHLAAGEDSELSIEPLMRSSDRAALLDAERLQFLNDPESLLAEFSPTGERYTLAARVSGRVPRAFAGSEADESSERYELNAIVVGDVDLLADRYWVRRQQFFGDTLLEPFAGNGDFVINAIDNLMGNADLISVRSRDVSNRPFTLVDSLRRQAEADLRAKEQQLEAELAETEQRLTELQRARGDTDLAVLTPEQQAELDRFSERRLEIRKELRQVRRQLDEEIEALGTRVKMINIGLMPALVTAFALFVAWRRRQTSRKTAQGGSE